MEDCRTAGDYFRTRTPSGDNKPMRWWKCRGVKIQCLPCELTDKSDVKSDHPCFPYIQVDVPRDHPVFSAPRAKLPALFYRPLRIKQCHLPKGPPFISEEIQSGNPDGAVLQLDLGPEASSIFCMDEGQYDDDLEEPTSREWQPDTGCVLVVRADGKNLDVVEMFALGTFLGFGFSDAIQWPEEYRGVASQEVLKSLAKENLFHKFFEDAVLTQRMMIREQEEEHRQRFEIAYLARTSNDVFSMMKRWRADHSRHSTW
ncbi:hypothetical protein AJ80_04111 [Polytolypa hystricis UAMH7299]|uniref:Uncharacterized protein n=1 Tax=Polytolypa hystricis (strain UAMH7299) TaxID=1447883 RepID=A0A2B7YCJ4_POLH7|nr:hypothetical protein AJ80_04111 [Polytolypa hystricis UAMH7299]